MSTKTRNRKSDSQSGTGAMTPAVDSRAIAWWAEKAHGLQGERLGCVQRASGDLEIVPLSDVNAGEEVLFEVFTPAHVPPMVRPEKLILKAPNGPEIPLHDMPEYDSLFWTASAIEKFVFPYYAAQRLLTEQQMASLMADFNRANLVAIAHVAPSKPTAILDAFQVLTITARAAAAPRAQWQGLLQYVTSR